MRLQNSRMARSCAGKSICVSTLSNGMEERPRGQRRYLSRYVACGSARASAMPQATTALLHVLRPVADDRGEIGGIDVRRLTRRHAVAAVGVAALGDER